MSDRRRFAFVATPLLGLLAALLLGASVATAQAPDPLTLTLTAERAECTAGTLNPVTWEISGGTPPYTLTVDGASVDADAESATVTCGALPEGTTDAPGTITATVTDATGAPATASAAYTIVPPLPAPTGLEHVSPYPGSVQTSWSDVPGAAEMTLEDAEGTPYTIDAYLVRYRAVGASEWIHVLQERTVDDVWEVFDAGIREFSVAALRHPLERLTPAALRWSAAHPYAAVAAPQNVVATATHDTVTVSWDKQPHGEPGVVWLSGAGGGVSEPFPMATSAGRYSITFGDLPPSTTYNVYVDYQPPERPDDYTRTEVTTLAPPPDYEPLPSGPQNLRATATHNSITVSWDPSRPATPLRYSVQVFHAESGIRVDVRDLPEGTTSVTVIGTFWRIQPDTLYEVVVFELGIPTVIAEVAVTTQAAPAAQSTGPAPLRVSLTAERAECTAGTLNPVSWEIEGGVEPYRLTVDGASVDADAESAHATCGALPDYGLWLPVTQAPGTITATVTDATGAPATASAAYTIVPPLPAPTNFQVGPHPGVAYTGWDSVRGAGSQYPEFDASQLSPAERDQRLGAGYLVRYRTDATSAWTYAEHSDGEWTTQYGYVRPWETPPPGTFYTASVAAARHPLELETPAALNWSAPIRYSTPGPAQNLTVRATHNSVTVSWSKQPGTGHASAHLWNPRGGGELRILTEGDEPGTHTVTFNHLEPNSEYKIWIFQLLGDGRAAVSRSFRTAAAPPDWQPLPRGPQNLRATATHDTITVTWDPPFEGASPRWSAAMLDGEILVHILESNDGTTTWVSSGEVDSIGRYRIRPNTTYTIIVRHHGVRRVEQTITVTTQAAPPLQSTGPAITCTEITPGWRICWTPDVTAG